MVKIVSLLPQHSPSPRGSSRGGDRKFITGGGSILAGGSTSRTFLRCLEEKRKSPSHTHHSRELALHFIFLKDPYCPESGERTITPS